MCVYFIRVLLTSGNFFSQLVCVPYEWRLKILIIVILNAIVSVLTEVRNSNGKNAFLLSRFFFPGYVFVFCLEGLSLQCASVSGHCFLVTFLFLKMPL